MSQSPRILTLADRDAEGALRAADHLDGVECFTPDQMGGSIAGYPQIEPYDAKPLTQAGPSD